MAVNNIRTFSENIELVNERREHVRKCATDLFVKKPFSESSMQEILDACGMSKGGLYYYVGSKDDIRKMIFDHASQAYIGVHKELKEKLPRMSAKEALHEVISRLCHWMDEYQNEVIVIVHEIGSMTKEEREPQLDSERANVSLIEEILHRGIDNKEIKVNDVKIAAHTLFLGIRSWAERRWYLRRYYTLDQYIDNLYQLSINFLTMT